MLCNVIPSKKKAGTFPVYLNVYDLTSINGYAYWLGLGVYHSGVQVHEVEYAFGAHDYTTTGIFEGEPKQCPGFTYRKSILIGRTDRDPKQVREFMEKLADEYPGNTYNLITKNCNHFCNDVCVRITGKAIPSWVNRLAKLGLLCTCVLPMELQEAKVRHKKPDSIVEGGSTERKKLRSRSSRFISSSTSCSSTPSSTDSTKLKNSSRSNSSRQRRASSPAMPLASSPTNLQV
ncbi:Desi-like protein [Thalictrum thalictroides]|uniref:Desi-like protein n=1 Tax=Thalictrum thalictroides TaxID=46969 RepID=A0A7J6VXX4_THATH|nr:Desi-like protein [Thalictrum thalictroides]